MRSDVGLSIRQFVEAWRILCRAAPAHAIESGDGIEYCFSGVPIPFFNAAILTGSGVSGDALQAHGNSSCEWANSRGVPWLLLVTHEALEPNAGAAARLARCGLTPLMPLTGMEARHVPPAASIPDGLELRRPEDDAGCEAVLDVNAAAYGIPLDAGKQVWGRTAFWKDHYAVVGVAGERPVSCAAVLMADGYRYVALVATAPGQQRRGYADAAMRHALDLAARAHQEAPTFLHATEAGRPVYERMGYRSVTTHTIFIEKKFLVG